MRFVDRLIIIIFGLLLIGVAVEGTFLCFNPDLDITDAQEIYYLMVNYRWFFLIAMLVCLVIGLFVLFASGFHRQGKTKSNLVSAGKSGDNVQISMGAIDCIVSQVVKGYSTVKSVSTTVDEYADGIKVRTRAVVDGDINIPELADSLRADIKTQLETMVGLNVKDVKILISDVVAKPITVQKTSSHEDNQAENQ